MIEIMENVTSTRILFQSALQAYLDACSAFRESAMAGEFPLAKLKSFTSDELATFINHEGRLQTAKALLGNVQNHTKPVGSLPSEILSHIFHLVPLEPLLDWRGSYYRFPKRLEYISHTCSHWRQAALDTPSLWTSLCFAPQIALNGSFISRAEVYAARAGGLPLEINIEETPHKRAIDSLLTYSPEDNRLLELLPLVAHRVSSVKLQHGPLFTEDLYSRYYRKLLEACLAGATPGILTRLDIYHKLGPRQRDFIIGSFRNSSERLDLALDIPPQRLDDLLRSITSLTLRGIRFPWASKAFHGLFELTLASPDGSGLSEITIPESRLYRILLSSPGLRVFALDMRVQASHLSDNLVTPVVLEDLEVLDLEGLKSSYLGTVLRLVAPGSKLSVVWLDFDDTDIQDPYLGQDLKSFFGRVNTPNLGLTRISSLGWLETLRGLVNNMAVVALHDVRIFRSTAGPVPQWESNRAGLSFADRVHLSQCTMPLAHLSWILDTFRPHTLTLWGCRVLDLDTWGELEEAIPTLSQRFPYVNVLQNDVPDPVWDKC